MTTRDLLSGERHGRETRAELGESPGTVSNFFIRDIRDIRGSLSSERDRSVKSCVSADSIRED